MIDLKLTKTLVSLFWWHEEIKNRTKRIKYNIHKYEHKLAISYGKNNRQCFDLFKAPNSFRKNILLIDIHGGFYVGGNRQDNFPFVEYFLDRGIDVCLVEYRLNNKKIETKDEISDCKNCVEYIYNHLKDYELENDKVFLAGDSAGGHIALYLAEAIKGNTFLGEVNYKIDGLVLSSPAYHYEKYGSISSMTKSFRKWFLGPNYNDDIYLAKYSPYTYINDLDCPVFLNTCKKDFIREESLDLYNDLKERNIDTTFVDIDSKEKKVVHVHNVCHVTLDESKSVNEQIYAFLVRKRN